MKRTLLTAALTAAAFLSIASPAQAEDVCVCVVVRGVFTNEASTGWQCQGTPLYTYQDYFQVGEHTIWVGVWVRTPLGSTP